MSVQVPMQVETSFAQYFDGVSTNALRVFPTLDSGVLVLRSDAGEIRRTPLEDMRSSVSKAGAYAIVYFADGASLQLSDAALIAKISPEKSLSDVLSQNWRSAALTVLLLVALVFSIYRWGIPVIADAAAKYVPDSWAQSIQTSVVADADRGLCKPSKFSDTRQATLQEKFKKLQLTTNSQIKALPQAQLLFRHCEMMGPNAFNVGREVIVLVDEMVFFAKTDDAVMGVLAHELGHLQADHVMRGILRYAGVGALSAVLLGDVSAIVAAAPALVLRNQYSQVFEREADVHALARLKAANIPTQPLADMFRKLSEHGKTKNSSTESERQDKKASKNKDWEWLFSHPDSAERAKLFDQ